MNLKSIATTVTFLIQNITADKEKLEEKHNEKINKIINDYKLTKNYPRKKKKRIRKELNFDYGFFMQLHEMDNMEFHW